MNDPISRFVTLLIFKAELREDSGIAETIFFI